MKGTCCTRCSLVAKTILAGVIVSFGCGGKDLPRPNIDASTASSGRPQESGDATVCVVAPSNYDTSCKADSECVLLAFGDYCKSSCICPSGYINRSSLTDYMNDVSRAPSAATTQGNCRCPSLGPGCCQSGQCVSCYTVSSNVQDAAPSDAGAPPAGSTPCSKELGPLDGGASDDAGSIRWCIPGESCTQFNGGWSCCSSVGPAGTLCHN
jgi:hypothetical protein